MQYVIAVAELRNFGQAAKRCSITQSTLSTMIGRFEDEIGIRIFDRKTKPVTITKEGESILMQLRMISKEIQNLTEVVQTLKGELIGELKIGVIPTVAPYILPRFLNDFARKLPKINFTVSEMVTSAVIDLLLKRELDIGIAAIPFGNDNFIEIPLYDEPFVLYDHLSRTPSATVSVEDIDYRHLWLLEEGHCLSTQVKRICKLKDHTNTNALNFHFKAGSLDSLIRFVKAESGTTLLPYLATLDLPADEKRKLRAFQASVPVRTIGLVIHKHFVKKQIIDLLQAEIQSKIQPLLDKNANKRWVVAPL